MTRGLVVAAVALAACSTRPANDDPTGFACGSSGECSPSFACDRARNVCVAATTCRVGSDGFCQHCGDGVTTGSEECDDRAESKRCNADCTLSACGDGVINHTAGEQCDDESFNSATAPDACRTLTCALPTCGDGVIDTHEQCDDDNTSAGDGCSATCALEPGWSCRSAPSHCWQQLVTGAGVVTAAGPLASLFIDFSEVVADELSDGVTAVSDAAKELFAVETDDGLGNRLPVALEQVAFARRDGKPCMLGNAGSFGCDRVVLTVAAAASNCSTALERLRFDTAYRVRASARLRAADGAPGANLPADRDLVVVTPAPLHVTALTTSNGTTACDLLTGGCDVRVATEGDRVPVNSSVNLHFSAAMEPTSLVASTPPDPARDTVMLRDLTHDCDVPVRVTMSSPDLFHVVPATRSAQDCGGGPLASTFAFDTAFELVIAGRRLARPGSPGCSTNTDGYVEACAASGRHLPDDVTARFRTSSATQLTGPVVIPCDQAMQFRSSRPVSQPDSRAWVTLYNTSSTFSGPEQASRGEQWYVVPLGPSSCASTGPASLQIDGPADLLDNPLAPSLVNVRVVPAVSGTPQLASTSPPRAGAAATCAADGSLVLPSDTSGGAALAGHSGVALITAAGAASRPLVRSAAAGLVVEDVTSGTARAVAFDVDGQLSPDLSLADALFVTPRAPMKAGRRYRFHATTRLMTAGGAAFPCAALAAQLPVVVAGRSCAPGGSCAPGVVAVTPGADAQNVASTTTVVVTFDQGIDPASVADTGTGQSTGNLQVVGPGGAIVAGTWQFTGARWYDGAVSTDSTPQPGYAYTKVTFTPTRPLKAGRHVLKLVDALDATTAGRPCKDPTAAPLEPGEPARAVTDAAGNCLRKTDDLAFTVEAAAPWITALTADTTAPERVVLRFNEPLDDLAEPTFIARSGVSCFDQRTRATCTTLAGSTTGRRCAGSHTCDTVVLTPALPFGWFNRGPSAAWTVVTGTPAPADLGGTPLASTTTQGVPLNGVANTFAPASTEARLLCTDPPHDPAGAHPITSTQPLTLTFSHPVQRSTVSRLLAENACTGEALKVAVTPETDGSQYTLLPTAGRWPDDAVIAIAVGQAVLDVSAHPLALPTHVRFKVGAPGLCR